MDRNQLLNDYSTSFRVALDGRQAQIWTALPAQVVSYNPDHMTIECQPTIQGVVEGPNDTASTPPTYVNLPLLVDVPVVFQSGGGFTFTFPLEAGDEVLVILASRCIDSWWQQGGIGIPIESRMHDLSDGFAIPGPKSQPNVLTSVNTSVPEIRNNSGSIKLAFTSSGFKITGDLQVTGQVQAGSVSSSGEVTGNGIPLSTHTHLVTTAPGTTGAPLP